MTALNTPGTVDAWAEEVIRTNAPDLLAYFVRRVEPALDAADVLSNALLVIWDKRRRIPADANEARMWSFGWRATFRVTIADTASDSQPSPTSFGVTSWQHFPPVVVSTCRRSPYSETVSNTFARPSQTSKMLTGN